VVGEPSGLQDTLLFGVFDGHGPDGAGSRIARTTASELHRIISKRLSAHEVNDDHNNAVHTLLRKAFIEFDEYLSLQNDDSQVKEGFLNWLFGFRGNPGYHHAGTCAVIALVGPTKVYIASIGDSRAITSKGGHITRLHRASESDEAERIYWNGGFIADNRVNGELIPTRAFGDFRYKSGGTHDCHIVSCLPEVIDVSREQIGSYLILGSDGVFDILTPAQVLSETTDREQLVPPEVIAQSIVDHAVHLGSKDNVTCVVIHLGSTETASE
jgi:serine/threonine protein phosphatase PrpC